MSVVTPPNFDRASLAVGNAVGRIPGQSCKTAHVQIQICDEARMPAISVAIRMHAHERIVQANSKFLSASIRITLDLYSHVAPGTQDEADAKIAAFAAGAQS